MKKLLITAALMSVFTLANANLAGASINGKQVRKFRSCLSGSERQAKRRKYKRQGR